MMTHQHMPAVLGGVPASPETIPVSCPTLSEYDKLADGFRDVVTSGIITRGKYVELFERRMASYIGVNHAVAVSSNTSGLLLVLKALGLKGEVILPSFTFSVTGHVLTWNNLTPSFVDADPETCLIDPRAVEAAVTSRTSAILGVHVWGNPCSIAELQAIADRHGLVLLFDSAQAMGSKYVGQPLGGFGRAEVFSCSPTKLLTSCEGGLVTTNDPELARLIRIGRNYGDGGSYDCEFEGLNARMSELHALVGLSSLEMLEQNLERRNALVARYASGLEKHSGIRLPRITPRGASNGVYFSILVDEDKFGLSADELMAALKAENIETRRYYRPPLHRQRVNADLTATYDGRLQNTECIVSQSLTLPIFSHMTLSQVDLICHAVERIQIHRLAIRQALAGK